MSLNRFRARYRTRGARPLILAHRGDSFHAPENTLQAARLGHQAGADGWEVDVHLTSDGVPVVLHDESLLRTTDIARRFRGDPRADSGFLVGHFTAEEVRSLDAGSWFVDPSGGTRSAAGFGTLADLPGVDRILYASGSVRVPTLPEALAMTRQLDWMINVEIKPPAGDPTDLIDAVLAEIRSSGTTELATVSSFDHAIVASVAAREPGLATGALVTGPSDRPASEILGSLGADALHAPSLCVGPSPSAVPVLVYTVNDAGLADRLADAGVFGLLTDDPASFTNWDPVIPSSRHTRPRWGTAEHRSVDR